jgi:hypothetical protein
MNKKHFARTNNSLITISQLQLIHCSGDECTVVTALLILTFLPVTRLLSLPYCLQYHHHHLAPTSAQTAFVSSGVQSEKAAFTHVGLNQ